MAFDGNGAYQHPSPQYPFLNGTTISAEDMNEIMAEIAGALSLTLLRDNSGSGPTTSISWKLHKLIDLGNGAADGDAVNYGQVFKSPVFDNPQALASPPLDDDSLKLATTEFVRTFALNGNLPGQTLPKAGYALITNGTTADWQSLDARGIKFTAKGDSGAAPVTFDWAEAEAHSLTITGATTITFTGWPTDRAAVRLLTLTNAGLFPPTFQGVVFLDVDGKETVNFAETGVTWQTAGRDRVIICKEPGNTPWLKVVR